MPDNEELAKLLQEPPKTQDPEILKLVLLLANKALDQNKLNTDDDGFLLTRSVNF